MWFSATRNNSRSYLPFLSFAHSAPHALLFVLSAVSVSDYLSVQLIQSYGSNRVKWAVELIFN